VNHDSNFSKSEEEATALCAALQRVAESPLHSLFRNQLERKTEELGAAGWQGPLPGKLTVKEIFEAYDSANRDRDW
jgi:hypothetical protein